MESDDALEAICYKEGKLYVLDQLQLPLKMVYEQITGVEDGWQAIRKMKVRGAPCIAIVGCLSLAVELSNYKPSTKEEAAKFITDQLKYLTTARPTAVNIMRKADDVSSIVSQQRDNPNVTANDLCQSVIKDAESMLANDVQCNKQLGAHGALHIKQHTRTDKQRILTHCNTGSLATAGYGTALGVIRALHKAGNLEYVMCTETRPYNQGARLTAFELVHDNIPAFLIGDSMAAFAMTTKNITAVVVGADRVVSNGDTANKIGTYQLAISAKYHDVPFYVACPSTTCDFKLANGDGIIIEERAPNELTHVNGIQLAPEGIGVWNPAFDVTPASLITGGIITEYGVFKPGELKTQLSQYIGTDSCE